MYHVLWNDPTRLAAARAAYAADPLTNPSSPMEWATVAVLDASTANQQAAANQVYAAIQNSFADTRDGLGALCCTDATAQGCDGFRYSQWVAVAFDWIRPFLTADQINALLAPINQRVTANLAQKWGGYNDSLQPPVWMVGCDYFWSNLMWAWSWAAATADLQDVSAYVSGPNGWQARWSAFQTWAQSSLNGPAGMFPAGSQYGYYCYGYPVLAYLTDHASFSLPTWFANTVNRFCQDVSDQPVQVRGGGSYFQVLNFQDDEEDVGFDAFDRDGWLVDYLYAMQEILGGTPQAGYAAQLLANTGDAPSAWLRYGVTPATPQAFTGLPLITTYGPWLIIHQSWDAGATKVYISLNHGTNFGRECGGLEHADFGSFAVLKGGRWRIKNQAGYATTFYGGGTFVSAQNPGGDIVSQHFGANSVPFVDYGGGYGSGPSNTTPGYTISDDGDLVTVVVNIVNAENPTRTFQYRRSTDVLTVSDTIPLDNATDWGTPHVRFCLVSQPVQNLDGSWTAPEGVTIRTTSSTYPATYESGYFGQNHVNDPDYNPNKYGWFLDVKGQYTTNQAQQFSHQLTFTP